jgi:hypothetical protein
MFMRSSARFTLQLLLLATVVPGCQSGRRDTDQAGGPRVRGVNINDPVQPVPFDRPITLAAARNEWTSFAIQLSDLPEPARGRSLSMRLRPLRQQAGPAIDVAQYSAYEVLSLPIDVNRAGYVRHTGLLVQDRTLPRALLPVKMNKGVINLATLRSPHDATSAGSHADPLLWVDLQIPPETPAGEYSARCDLVESGNKAPLASVELRLTVHDFVLPDERHLLMISRLDWDDLQRLYPQRFEAVRPQFISRNDERYAATVRTLDQLVTMAQEHRTQVIIPRLQPIVKWLPDRPPQVDWKGIDSVLQPWMRGDVFRDRVPLGLWALPAPDGLAAYDPDSRMAYWSEAASHFDHNGWLSRAAVFIESFGGRSVGAAESIQLSADAARVLNVHDDLRVMVPLEEDQIQLAGENNPNLVNPKKASRLIAASPGLVFEPPLQTWPADVPRPQQWLRTDVAGLVPYIGAGGDERDVCLWSWLAFLRNASFVLWGSPLPRTDTPAEPADPDDLVWFYPGEWFGVDAPVPTIQLKWLRRAQQDYEYLWLARQRGEQTNALVMARLMTKTVEIQPTQPRDPTYALMCGTTDPAAWAEAKRLLAACVLLREPGEEADPARRNELNLQMLRWAEPQEQPRLLARKATWHIEPPDPQNPGNWTSLRVGIDIYNPSDMDLQADENLLQWTSVTPPWQVNPHPVAIPSLPTYGVQRFPMDAKFNLDALRNVAHRRPLELTFVDGFHHRRSHLRIVLPVAACEPRRPGVTFDGKLGDWQIEDAIIHDAPLISMFNRPAIQQQEMELAQSPATVYTAWSEDDFYVAFKLAGVGSAQVTSTRNFVEYQFRRAWGEDLCEILVQPVYADNSVGPVLHMVCKPTGHWIERKGDPRRSVDPWQPLEGVSVRYVATMDQDWRGEVAIPWKAIADTGKGRPKLLRFNFSQHRDATGESASWAGPIDFGRDEGFMGLLHLRETDEPGLVRTP